MNFEHRWEKVSRIIKILLTDTKFLSRKDWLESFSLVYYLCEDNFERTCIQTRQLLESHVEEIKDELVKADDKLLMYQVNWDKYYRGVQYVSQFCSHIDRLRNHVGAMAFDVWRHRLLQLISSDVINLLKEKIKSESGNTETDSVIHDVIQSFVQIDSFLPEKRQLSTYQTYIEKRYLDDTEEFYRVCIDAQKLLVSDPSEYRAVVLDWLEREKRRCQKYLHKSSLEIVTETRRSQILSSGHLTLLQSEVSDIFKKQGWSTLQNMYQLFKSAIPDKSAIESLSHSFWKYMTERGSHELKTLFQNSKNQNDTALANNFVEWILKVQYEYASVIKDYFDNDKVFLTTLDLALSDIVTPYSNHLNLLQSEVSDIFKKQGWSTLQNMYQLFKSAIPDKSAIESLSHSFWKYMTERGSHELKTLFQNSKNQNDTALANNFVEWILKVQYEYASVIKDYFDNDKVFTFSLDLALSDIVTQKEESSTKTRSSKLLAIYCDFLLREKKVSETEIDKELTMAASVVKYIQERDVFQEFYRKNLAKRLFQNQSISMVSEKYMIEQLRVVCGFGSVDKFNRMDRMVTDIESSSGLNQSFSDYLTESNHNNDLASFHINVLSTGFWPLGRTPTVTARVPEDIQRFVDLFREFYDTKFVGRRLSWLHHKCSGDIILRGFEKSYMVNMSTYQYAVLNLFNRATALTAGEIIRATDLTQENLKNLVESMIGSYDRILTVSPPVSDQFTEASVIRVNENFSNSSMEFKLPSVLPQEIQQARSSINEDRSMFLQAAIIRIMKSRKTMKHNDLVQEVIRQSAGKFQPNISNIKKAIEGLIEKEYLKRNTEMNEVYEYIV